MVTDYFGARYYDPEVARWLSVDPLANKYPSWSPYNYSLNNPVTNFDPDGRAVFSGTAILLGLTAAEITYLGLGIVSTVAIAANADEISQVASEGAGWINENIRTPIKDTVHEAWESLTGESSKSTTYDDSKKKVTQGNPAAYNKDAVRYNNQLSPQPPPDPENGSGKDIIKKIVVGGTIGGGLGAAVEQCVEDKKERELIKKQLEQLKQMENTTNDEIPKIEQDK